MKIEHVPPGTYVVAVSGGVDSMVLLDILHGQAGVHAVVAHYDHGIRSDSKEDRIFVENTALRYGLPFEYKEGELGVAASEATARRARYEFLRQVQAKYNATAIITAHHQDDLLETAVLNMLRGTGHKGLHALASRPECIRPMLALTKKQIVLYAKQHHIAWREDATNASDRYTRNYIRHHVLARADDRQRRALLTYIDDAARIGNQIEELLARESLQASSIQRQWFNQLPHAVCCEVLASWLRKHKASDFDRRRIERLTVLLKTKPAGKKIDVNKTWHIAIGKHDFWIKKRTQSKISKNSDNRV